MEEVAHKNYSYFVVLDQQIPPMELKYMIEEAWWANNVDNEGYRELKATVAEWP